MDWTLFFTVAAMVAVGLIMIYSASSITAERARRRWAWLGSSLTRA